jgi:hypothetical protein
MKPKVNLSKKIERVFSSRTKPDAVVDMTNCLQIDSDVEEAPSTFPTEDGESQHPAQETLLAGRSTRSIFFRERPSEGAQAVLDCWQ